MNDHRHIEERSLAMHRLVARKLLADPGVLDVARDNLRRWRMTDGSPTDTLAEWEAILGRPLLDLVGFLEDTSEQATRLRQSSPFAGLLTEAERGAIYESYSTRTYHPRGQSDLG